MEPYRNCVISGSANTTSVRNIWNRGCAAPGSSTFVAAGHKTKNENIKTDNTSYGYTTTAGVPTTAAPSPAPGLEQTIISQIVRARIMNSNSNSHNNNNNNITNINNDEAKTARDDTQHDHERNVEELNMMMVDSLHDQQVEDDNMNITEPNDESPMFCEQQQQLLLLQLQSQPQQQQQQQQQQPHPDAYASGGGGNPTITSVFNVEPKTVEKITSAELKSLSAVQREEILEELHGIRSTHREETPELIDESLRQMDYELENVIPVTHPTKAHAYLLAKSLNSTFVRRNDVRLKFLRCVFFDVPQATVRFLKYLDVVLDYYGVIGLMRPIMLDDLNDEEMALMKQGEVQLLPERDHPFGRRIGVTFGVEPKNAKYSNRCRVSGRD